MREKNVEGVNGFFCLIQWDEKITERLAVCSSQSSKWGYARPFMRLLEYSGHGLLWIIGDLVLILILHKVEIQQILMNLLLGLYYFSSPDVPVGTGYIRI